MIDNFGADVVKIQKEIDDISHNLKFVRKKSHSTISNLLKNIKSFSHEESLNHQSLINSDVNRNYIENNLNDEN